MVCETCGEKHKKCGNCNKDFPRAVVEINNPEEVITLLRKVVIPASMGTEEQVPAAVGKYHNVVLYYEANKHTYIYSSDGIPTFIETEIPQELIDRIETLEVDVGELDRDLDALDQEVQDLKNSPDVVDIVSTYADLQNYDTSTLTDKDVIRVLTDETHDDASSYYRWDEADSQWTFIGITGPYYTKTETDTLIEAARKTWVGTEVTASDTGATAEVTTTSGDFEWNEGHTVTVNFTHKANRNLLKIDSETAYSIDNVRSLSGGIDTGIAIQYVCTIVGGQRAYRPIGRLRASSDVAGPVFIADNLTTSGSALKVLAANQGKVLNDKIGDLTTLSTTDKSSTVAAINEVISGLTPVVQTTGISTTDVMSQNATTSMAYSDPATKYHIVLGDGATNTGGGDGSVAIGRNAHAHGDTVSIGTDSGNILAQANHQINIGHGAGNSSNHENSISIGDYSEADYIGAIAIGSSTSTSSSAKATKRSAIAIGTAAIANGERSVALGNGAIVDSTGTRSISLEGQCFARGAVALGAGSAANIEGTVDVGAAWHISDETWGYLGSDYRRITGVYDGQALHDAATLAQANTLSDSAPTTATVGVLGQLYTDTTNMHTYQCTYIDDSDPNNPPLYTWTQRW